VTPTPTVLDIFASLQSFLAAVLPPDVVIQQAQPNRVAEVAAPRFVLMSPPAFKRLETNINSSADAVFTGSITGPTMTITAVDPRFPTAEIGIGTPVQGVGITVGTAVTAVLTGSGQIGTYTVNNPQTFGPGTISCGGTTIQMNVTAAIQLDFHSSDTTSGDLANVVSATMRDRFAIDQFANQSPNYGVVPLYADDAIQAPFQNDQAQIEWRWIVSALLQANITVVVPTQFADSVALTLKSLYATFPT
jgi:hypothetical protein